MHDLICATVYIPGSKFPFALFTHQSQILNVSFYHFIKQNILSTAIKKTNNFHHVFGNKLLHKSGYELYMNKALSENLQNKDGNDTCPGEQR